MAVSLEKFAASLMESGVIPEADLNAYVQRYNPVDTDQFARGLVRQKLLTTYQAQQAYAGKAKALVLGNYVILDKLGQGGMGLVLKARHRQMNRLVALKILSPAIVKAPDALARFQREVQTAARLEHPNIVVAYDAGEAHGTHFFVMQFVDGCDLASLVKTDGPLHIDLALNYIQQAATGLGFAHQQGIIHRDIKPANLLLDQQGTVKILDMGLARIEGDTSANAALTGTGVALGTVDYMAPEQALDAKSADARSDLYSLGMTLWFLLTGRPAYLGDSLTARLLAHANSPIPSLTAVRPDVPQAIEILFQRLVAKSPGERFQSTSDLLNALETCQSRDTQSLTAVASGDAARMHRQGPSNQASRNDLLPDKTTQELNAASRETSHAGKYNENTTSVTQAANADRELAPSAFRPNWLRGRRVLWGGVAVMFLILPLLLLRSDVSEGETKAVQLPAAKAPQRLNNPPGQLASATPPAAAPAEDETIDLLARRPAGSSAVLTIGNGSESNGGIPFYFRNVEHGDFYTLTLDLEREANSGPTEVFLLVDDHPCSLHLHSDRVGRKGFKSGLSLVKGESVFSAENPTSVSKRVIPSDKRFQLVCHVRPHRVAVLVDGIALLVWKGSPAQLSPHSNQATSIARQGPLLGIIQFGGTLKCYAASLRRHRN